MTNISFFIENKTGIYIFQETCAISQVSGPGFNPCLPDSKARFLINTP